MHLYGSVAVYNPELAICRCTQLQKFAVRLRTSLVSTLLLALIS